jgi:hypothetical protein
MEMKPDATTTCANTTVDGSLMTLQADQHHNVSPAPSAVAAAAATAAMKTLENSTKTINNNASYSFPLTSKEQHDHSSRSTAAAETNMNNPYYTTMYAVANLPSGPYHDRKEREPTHRDVILNDWEYGNPKFHTWIQEHQEAFSLATSLSAQTILIQGLIQVRFMSKDLIAAVRCCFYILGAFFLL